MKHLPLLKKLIKNSTHHQHRMACLILNKNRVISVGFNKVQTHPAVKSQFHMLHAETHAIIGCSYEELKGCTAIIYRETKAGNPGMARCCPTCMLALQQVGIKKIIYSTIDGFKEERI